MFRRSNSKRETPSESSRRRGKSEKTRRQSSTDELRDKSQASLDSERPQGWTRASGSKAKSTTSDHKRSSRRSEDGNDRRRRRSPDEVSTISYEKPSSSSSKRRSNRAIDDLPQDSSQPESSAFSNQVLSSHIPNQFPDQTPLNYSAPYLPGKTTALGAAAEYYGDQGESIFHQPGVRPGTPIIVGAEPHLMPASSEPAPPVETGSGAAADFYATVGTNHSETTMAPVSGIPQPLVQDRPPPGRPPMKPSRPSNASIVAGAAGMAGAAAVSAAASHHHNHGQQQQSSQHTSQHSPSASHRPSGTHHATSHYGGTTNMSHSQHTHPGQQQEYGPLEKLMSWWNDYEDVRKMEIYTEYIGVCRHCFDPRSSANQAPRPHHPRKVRSRDSLNQMRISEGSRYKSADADGPRQRQSSWLAAGLAGVGLGQVASLFDDADSASDSHSDHRSGKDGARTSAPFGHSQISVSRRHRSSSSAAADVSSHRRKSNAHLKEERAQSNIERTDSRRVAEESRLQGDETVRVRRRRRNSQSSSGSDAEAGFWSGIFGTPKKGEARRRGKLRRRSKDSGSSASSEHDDATARRASKRDSAKTSDKQQARRSSSEDARKALVGLGAATAALAAHESRRVRSGQGKDVVAVRQSKLGNSTHSKARHEVQSDNPSDDGGWESAYDDSDADSNLAFGAGSIAGSDISNSMSSASISSRELGTEKWNWRWGNKRSKPSVSAATVSSRRTRPSVPSDVGLTEEDHSRVEAPTVAQYQTSNAAYQRPLEYVDPIPLNDARSSIDTYNIEPRRASPPKNLPLDQPRPLMPARPLAGVDLSEGSISPASSPSNRRRTPEKDQRIPEAISRTKFFEIEDTHGAERRTDEDLSKRRKEEDDLPRRITRKPSTGLSKSGAAFAGIAAGAMAAAGAQKVAESRKASRDKQYRDEPEPPLPRQEPSRRSSDSHAGEYLPALDKQVASTRVRIPQEPSVLSGARRDYAKDDQSRSSELESSENERPDTGSYAIGLVDAGRVEVRREEDHHGEPIFDDEIFDPNLFKRPKEPPKVEDNNEQVQAVFADFQDRYTEEQQSSADFFSPPELRGAHAEALDRRVDLSNDDIAAVNAPRLPDQIRSVPKLNIIAPTPPHSIAGSVRARSMSPSRSPSRMSSVSNANDFEAELDEAERVSDKVDSPWVRRAPEEDREYDREISQGRDEKSQDSTPPEETQPSRGHRNESEPSPMGDDADVRLEQSSTPISHDSDGAPAQNADSTSRETDVAAMGDADRDDFTSFTIKKGKKKNKKNKMSSQSSQRFETALEDDSVLDTAESRPANGTAPSLYSESDRSTGSRRRRGSTGMDESRDVLSKHQSQQSGMPLGYEERASTEAAQNPNEQDHSRMPGAFSDDDDVIPASRQSHNEYPTSDPYARASEEPFPDISRDEPIAERSSRAPEAATQSSSAKPVNGSGSSQHNDDQAENGSDADVSRNTAKARRKKVSFMNDDVEPGLETSVSRDDGLDGPSGAVEANDNDFAMPRSKGKKKSKAGKALQQEPAEEPEADLKSSTAVEHAETAQPGPQEDEWASASSKKGKKGKKQKSRLVAVDWAGDGTEQLDELASTSTSIPSVREPEDMTRQMEEGMVDDFSSFSKLSKKDRKKAEKKRKQAGIFDQDPVEKSSEPMFEDATKDKADETTLASTDRPARPSKHYSQPSDSETGMVSRTADKNPEIGSAHSQIVEGSVVNAEGMPMLLDTTADLEQLSSLADDETSSHPLEPRHFASESELDSDSQTLPLPESRPSSPTDDGSPQLSTGSNIVRDGQPPRVASSTSIPLRFRRPPQSPAFSRGSPLQSPSTTAGSAPDTPTRTRHPRPASTEFKSSTEFMPLYLVERNRRISEPEDSLPSLPSSRTTSRSPSVRDSDDAYESALESPGASETADTNPYELSIDPLRANQDVEYLDSGQTTPKAGPHSPTSGHDAFDDENTSFEYAQAYAARKDDETMRSSERDVTYEDLPTATRTEFEPSLIVEQDQPQEAVSTPTVEAHTATLAALEAGPELLTKKPIQQESAPSDLGPDSESVPNSCLPLADVSDPSASSAVAQASENDLTDAIAAGLVEAGFDPSLAQEEEARRETPAVDTEMQPDIEFSIPSRKSNKAKKARKNKAKGVYETLEDAEKGQAPGFGDLAVEERRDIATEALEGNFDVPRTPTDSLDRVTGQERDSLQEKDNVDNGSHREVVVPTLSEDRNARNDQAPNARNGEMDSEAMPPKHEIEEVAAQVADADSKSSAFEASVTAGLMSAGFAAAIAASERTNRSKHESSIDDKKDVASEIEASTSRSGSPSQAWSGATSPKDREIQLDHPVVAQTTIESEDPFAHLSGSKKRKAQKKACEKELAEAARAMDESTTVEVYTTSSAAQRLEAPVSAPVTLPVVPSSPMPGSWDTFGAEDDVQDERPSFSRENGARDEPILSVDDRELELAERGQVDSDFAPERTTRRDSPAPEDESWFSSKKQKKKKGKKGQLPVDPVMKAARTSSPNLENATMRGADFSNDLAPADDDQVPREDPAPVHEESPLEFSLPPKKKKKGKKGQPLVEGIEEPVQPASLPAQEPQPDVEQGQNDPVTNDDAIVEQRSVPAQEEEWMGFARSSKKKKKGKKGQPLTESFAESAQPKTSTLEEFERSLDVEDGQQRVPMGEFAAVAETSISHEDDWSGFATSSKKQQKGKKVQLEELGSQPEPAQSSEAPEQVIQRLAEEAFSNHISAAEETQSGEPLREMVETLIEAVDSAEYVQDDAAPEDTSFRPALPVIEEDQEVSQTVEAPQEEIHRLADEVYSKHLSAAGETQSAEPLKEAVETLKEAVDRVDDDTPADDKTAAEETTIRAPSSFDEEDFSGFATPTKKKKKGKKGQLRFEDLAEPELSNDPQAQDIAPHISDLERGEATVHEDPDRVHLPVDEVEWSAFATTPGNKKKGKKGNQTTEVTSQSDSSSDVLTRDAMVLEAASTADSRSKDDDLAVPGLLPDRSLSPAELIDTTGPEVDRAPSPFVEADTAALDTTLDRALSPVNEDETAGFGQTLNPASPPTREDDTADFAQVLGRGSSPSREDEAAHAAHAFDRIVSPTREVDTVEPVQILDRVSSPTRKDDTAGFSQVLDRASSPIPVDDTAGPELALVRALSPAKEDEEWALPIKPKKGQKGKKGKQSVEDAPEPPILDSSMQGIPLSMDEQSRDLETDDVDVALDRASLPIKDDEEWSLPTKPKKGKKGKKGKQLLEDTQEPEISKPISEAGPAPTAEQPALIEQQKETNTGASDLAHDRAASPAKEEEEWSLPAKAKKGKKGKKGKTEKQLLEDRQGPEATKPVSEDADPESMPEQPREVEQLEDINADSPGLALDRTPSLTKEDEEWALPAKTKKGKQLLEEIKEPEVSKPISAEEPLSAVEQTRQVTQPEEVEQPEEAKVAVADLALNRDPSPVKQDEWSIFANPSDTKKGKKDKKAKQSFEAFPAAETSYDVLAGGAPRNVEQSGGEDVDDPVEVLDRATSSAPEEAWSTAVVSGKKKKKGKKSQLSFADTPTPMEDPNIDSSSIPPVDECQDALEERGDDIAVDLSGSRPTSLTQEEEWSMLPTSSKKKKQGKKGQASFADLPDATPEMGIAWSSKSSAQGLREGPEELRDNVTEDLGELRDQAVSTPKAEDWTSFDTPAKKKKKSKKGQFSFAVISDSIPEPDLEAVQEDPVEAAKNFDASIEEDKHVDLDDTIDRAASPAKEEDWSSSATPAKKKTGKKSKQSPSRLSREMDEDSTPSDKAFQDQEAANVVPPSKDTDLASFSQQVPVTISSQQIGFADLAVEDLPNTQQSEALQDSELRRDLETQHKHFDQSAIDDSQYDERSVMPMTVGSAAPTEICNAAMQDVPEDNFPQDVMDRQGEGTTHEAMTSAIPEAEPAESEWATTKKSKKKKKGIKSTPTRDSAPSSSLATGAIITGLGISSEREALNDKQDAQEVLAASEDVQTKPRQMPSNTSLGEEESLVHYDTTRSGPDLMEKGAAMDLAMPAKDADQYGHDQSSTLVGPEPMTGIETRALQTSSSPVTPSKYDEAAPSAVNAFEEYEPKAIESASKNRASYLFQSPPGASDKARPDTLEMAEEGEALQKLPKVNQPLRQEDSTREDSKPLSREVTNDIRERRGSYDSAQGLAREDMPIEAESVRLNRAMTDDFETPTPLPKWHDEDLAPEDSISMLSSNGFRQRGQGVDSPREGSDVAANTRKAYIRSPGSNGRIIETEATIRPLSAQSNHSRAASGTSNRSGSATLRRKDRISSGSSDLRAASKRDQRTLSESGLASPNGSQHPLERQPPANYEPLKGTGNSRRQDMSDSGVLEAYGDVQDSPRSPIRPPSLRKRQSTHVLELESRLDQLLAENESLHEAAARAQQGRDIADDGGLPHAIGSRDAQIREKDAEIYSVRTSLETLRTEIARLEDHNSQLQSANANLSNDVNERYATIEAERTHAHEQWQASARQVEELTDRHTQLSTGMEGIVRQEIATALQNKNAEIDDLQGQLDDAMDKIASLQRQIATTRQGEDFLNVRDEDYFDSACQQLCQHVQQWVLRFSKFSDGKSCRPLSQLDDEKIETRLDNSILDGTDVDHYLADRVKRRDVFMSVVMTMIWEFVFTRYLFGMDRDQRQKLKSLEKTLSEVGPARAVSQWRATTLSLLSKREAFFEQRAQDTDAVVQEIFSTLSKLLPPPGHLAKQIKDSLRNIMTLAVDLSIEMRTQRPEYIMLPPLQPEYDANGDLTRKIFFNAALMNERSGEAASNEALDEQQAVVRVVLFPLVVKRGNDQGETNEEVVVCPAQVLIARPERDRKARAISSMAAANRSMQSIAPPSTMDVGDMVNRSLSIRSKNAAPASGEKQGGIKHKFTLNSLRGATQPDLSKKLYKLIKSETHAIGAYETAGRERAVIAGQLSEWGEETNDDAISDLSDKLGVLLSEIAEQEDSFSANLEESRVVLKSIRNTERSVQPSRDTKAKVADEIAKLKYKEPQSAKIPELEQELVRAEAQSLVAEAQLTNVTRQKFKESYDLHFAATIERAEKQILLAKQARRLLALLDDTPIVPGDVHPTFARADEARDILNDAETELHAWQPTHEPIPSQAGHLNSNAMPGVPQQQGQQQIESAGGSSVAPSEAGGPLQIQRDIRDEKEAPYPVSEGAYSREHTAA